MIADADPHPVSKPVLRIWIRIRMFLGLIDPDPPLVTGSDGSGSGYESFYHQAKIEIKTLISYCFVTFLDFLSSKKDVPGICTFKKK
jgi:hypothetical protein